MHPIVSVCGTVIYNTAKFITKILQNYCGKIHPLLKIVQILSRKIKYLSINPEETSVSFDVSALFTSIPVPVALQVINSKISTCTNFTNVCKTPTEKFIKLLESTITNCIFCSNKKFYKQLQVCSHGFTCFPCHCKYLFGTLWILSHSYISDINQMVVQVCWYPQYHQKGSHQQTERAPQLSIDPHIKSTIELPGKDGLPFLNTWPNHSYLHWIHSLQKTHLHT